ncbi:ATP-binding cassette domain-containing protein [Bacillus sp. S13(2024)]|uniref:ABC transporter ATP-binding protein n=1 Tax=unclassified Bacillus (in: firmicutes) TaxID=185979 RepID=UPI003D225263
MNNVAVKTHNLVKVFDGSEVIKGSTMTVTANTVYGFLGANGAGKTTVFKILSGLLLPTSGKVEIFGMDVTKKRDLILKSIGTLIEVPVFYENLSATENLKFHLAYMNAEGLEISKVLKMVGLVQTGDQPVSKFSLGMRQRLAIARAFIHKPKLLILDEPVNGLDPLGIQEMRVLFKDLSENYGMTILISSHILSELEHIVDSIGVIVNGIVVEEALLEEVKKKSPKGLEAYFFKIMSGGKVHA